jgi:hypothetical protein
LQVVSRLTRNQGRWKLHSAITPTAILLLKSGTADLGEDVSSMFPSGRDREAKEWGAWNLGFAYSFMFHT